LAEPSVRAQLVERFDEWMGHERLAKRIDVLKQLISTVDFRLPPFNLDAPLVIYMHCMGGIDRTGEHAGAYYLQHKGLSWSEVNQLNCNIIGGARPMMCDQYQAMRWFCVNLEQRREQSKANTNDGATAVDLKCSEPHMCAQNQPWLGYDCHAHGEYPCCRIPPAFPQRKPLNCSRACPNPPHWPLNCFLPGKKPTVKCVSSEALRVPPWQRSVFERSSGRQPMAPRVLAERFRRMFRSLRVSDLFDE